jgi:riboflavin kinase / FMN adenylyltransferase
LPPPGVYAPWARTGEAVYPAAVNLGPNPTFGGSEASLEAFLLGFEGELYGADLELRFVQAVRSEIAFQDPVALTEQIRRDVGAVQAILRARAFRLSDAEP